jgi:hypothetical protein
MLAQLSYLLPRKNMYSMKMLCLDMYADRGCQEVAVQRNTFEESILSSSSSSKTSG